jgi:hypothetical protein
LAIAAALVANTVLFIVPLLRRRTETARQSVVTGALADSYAALKAREDRHGGIN